MTHYNENPEPKTFFQVDVIDDVQILLAREDIEIIRPTKIKICPRVIKKYSELNDAFSKGIEVVLADAYITPILIISQTCDIKKRDFVHVSPIFPLARIEGKTRRESVVKGKTNYRFYLPSINQLEDSYADLSIINSVKMDQLNIQNRIVSLSDHYRHHLAYKLSNFFSRPFS
ncbi:hypothetical protein ES705_13529 [subsurface metagenome]